MLVLGKLVLVMKRCDGKNRDFLLINCSSFNRGWGLSVVVS